MANRQQASRLCPGQRARYTSGVICRMSTTIVVAVLASLAGATAPAAPALTIVERQHLVAHLEMTAAWLDDELANLTPAQVNFRRNADEWTIGEVVDHL